MLRFMGLQRVRHNLATEKQQEDDFWDASLPFSLSAGFPNKIAIPCPNMLPLDLLARCMVSSMSLDSVQFLVTQKCDPTRRISGTFLAAVRTTCPEDLPFKFPQSGTPCPSTGQLDQRINIWERMCSTQKGKSLQCVQLGTLCLRCFFSLVKPICFTFE